MEAQTSPLRWELEASEETRVERRRRLAKAEPIISVRGLDKSFHVPQHRPSTLKERILHPFRRIPKEEVHAARDISFEVAKGEFLGIVGRNGSGKSTLLTLLAGIYKPDGGEIEVRGRVSPFIALGVGFHGEMAAKDNVLINGTMLGLSRTETLKRFDRIIEFAGLEDFTELKLKNYSSGMIVRLAFATAIEVDADILLLDEVLAVGDAGFQEKCFEAFRRLKKEGKTIILVTHAMGLISRFCDRAIMLEEGRIVAEGDPEKVGERYLEVASEEGPAAEAVEVETHSFGDGAAKILDAWVEDQTGMRQQSVPQREPITLAMSVEFKERMSEPVFGIQLYRESGEIAFASNTLWAEMQTPSFAAGERATMRIELENRLGVGAYTITGGVVHRNGLKPADITYAAGRFNVRGKVWSGAAADLPHEISIDRGELDGR